MGLDPDLELLEAWRADDKRAASKLLGRYYPLIRRTVATKVPASEVDDIVQKVLLALHEGRERFRGDATFKTYAMGIARYKIADYFRHRPDSPPDVFGSSVRDLGAGISTLIIAHEDQRVLLEALRSIPVDDQLLLELSYWEEMSGPELAQVFECGVPAMRGRLRRAKERLRRELGKLAEGDRELADTMTDLDAWAQRLREELMPQFRRLKGERE